MYSICARSLTWLQGLGLSLDSQSGPHCVSLGGPGKTPTASLTATGNLLLMRTSALQFLNDGGKAYPEDGSPNLVPQIHNHQSKLFLLFNRNVYSF
ncbi:hypothetical protein AVEN_100877-1 [Araneus ventricosus]|uniref:Uncharacterized protein n=1 Tax=Araneus ventricosus TaxID=182803 RepID=A0A4Y2AYS7_ARAVE|nr:hypothetical protein AVEN_100877-1 [Araneus ventricosus]